MSSEKQAIDAFYKQKYRRCKLPKSKWVNVQLPPIQNRRPRNWKALDSELNSESLDDIAQLGVSIFNWPLSRSLRCRGQPHSDHLCFFTQSLHKENWKVGTPKLSCSWTLTFRACLGCPVEVFLDTEKLKWSPATSTSQVMNFYGP